MEGLWVISVISYQCFWLKPQVRFFPQDKHTKISGLNAQKLTFLMMVSS